MSSWNSGALFVLAGLVFACSGSSNGHDTEMQVGGFTTRASSTGAATSGGRSSSSGGDVGGTTPSTIAPNGGSLVFTGRDTVTGGTRSAVGTTTTGGSLAVGGVSSKAVGGVPASGGSRAVGGSAVAGGTRATGGAKTSAGTASIGGTSAVGTSAVGGATSASNKRGIAANVAPGAAFSPAVSWWYNWANKASGANVGIEFVPMVWNQTTVSSALPSGSRYVLGFNEPNFFVQANLSATEAASYWPALQITAKSIAAAVVGPGMNFCGPASQCHGTDPYQYLKDFFAACKDCQVDYVAVHWYNCDLPSLKDYLEPGGNLEGFEQFNKPIWITEFSCDGNATVAQQETYMRAAIPYLEGNPHVYRYSWFSAGPIPNAKLVKDDGTPTALGQVYIS